MKDKFFRYYKLFRNFGFKYIVLYILFYCIFKKGKIHEIISKKKDHEVLKILEQENRDIIDKYRDNYKDYSNKKITYDSPIWIMWYNGEETCPLIVRNCINSVRKYWGARGIHYYQA